MQNFLQISRPCRESGTISNRVPPTPPSIIRILDIFQGITKSKNNVFSIISSSQRLQNQLSEQEEMCLEWKLFSSHHMNSGDLAASFGKLLVSCSISVCVFYP